MYTLAVLTIQYSFVLFSVNLQWLITWTYYIFSGQKTKNREFFFLAKLLKARTYHICVSELVSFGWSLNSRSLWAWWWWNLWNTGCDPIDIQSGAAGAWPLRRPFPCQCSLWGSPKGPQLLCLFIWLGLSAGYCVLLLYCCPHSYIGSWWSSSLNHYEWLHWRCIQLPSPLVLFIGLCTGTR